MLIAAEVLAALGIVAAMLYLARLFPNWPTDIDVYRNGALTFLRGESIYDDLPPPHFGHDIPYIYPPFSVLMFVPLALAAPTITFPAMTVASTLALIPIVLAFRAGSPELRTITATPWMVAFAAFGLLVAHPVQNTLFWGQINVLLMALIALDLLWPNPRWPRGLLIGIAAAIKLTPAGFALIFLLRKDWRAVAVSAAAFLAATAVGFVLAPGDSIRYWTDRMFNSTEMYTGLPYANEGYAAGLEKLGVTGIPLSVLLYGGLLAIVAMTVLGTLRAVRDGNTALAMGVTAAGVLLVAPISWSHHWVLALPTAALILVMGYQRRNAWLVLAGSAAVVILWTAPHYRLPLYPEVWTVPQHIAGFSYQLLALALLVVMTVRQLTGRHAGGTMEKN